MLEFKERTIIAEVDVVLRLLLVLYLLFEAIEAFFENLNPDNFFVYFLNQKAVLVCQQ